jgi:hypothetical protein
MTNLCDAKSGRTLSQLSFCLSRACLGKIVLENGAATTHSVHDYEPVVDNQQRKEGHHCRAEVVKVVGKVVGIREGAVHQRRVALHVSCPKHKA